MAEQTGSEQLSEPAKLPGTSFSAPAPTSALTDPASAITDNDKRDLVRRISESSHLRKAPRLTELLNFLTERSISDCTVGLHEHEIGVSLFGREADYDTSQDNIVRVQVSQLRKKLDNYFAQEGLGDSLVVEIPRGAYLPVFRRRSVDSVSITQPVFSASTAIDIRGGGYSRSLVVALSIAVLLFAAASLWLWLRPTVPANVRTTDDQPSALASLWSQLIRQDTLTDVVLADSTLTILQDYSGGALSLDDLINRRFNSVFPPTMSSGERDQLLSMVERRYTSFTDVEMMVRIMRLRQPHIPVLAVHLARDYQIKSLKANNVILLGSKRSNPWVELFESHKNFRFNYPDRESQPIVLNSLPLTGEPASFVPVRDGIGYSTVTFLPNLNRTGAVMILEGENSISTNAAGEFVTSEEHLAKFFAMIGYTPGKASPPWFEVLLRIEKLQDAPRSFKIVAHRLIE